MISSFSDVYELESNAVVKAAVLSAGDPEKVPLNPEADDSIVAMNCVLSVDDDRNVTAGSVMYPWPYTVPSNAAATRTDNLQAIMTMRRDVRA